MSIDCFNATNLNAADVCLEAQEEKPFRLSTTSLEVFDIETTGNNGVLDLNSTSSHVSSSKISITDKQKPESNYAVLKKYQSIHLQSEETPVIGEAHTSGNRNDPKLESATAARPPSTAGTQKTRQYEPQAICRFYERNNFCKFGQNCRYLHEGGEHSSNVKESYLVQSSFDDNYSDTFESERYRNVEENEYFDHRRSYYARPVCRYFQYYGYCDYGDRCMYEHAFVPQTDRSKQHRQTPVKKSKKNLKEKEDQSTSSVNAAAVGSTDNSNLQNVLQSHVSDGDIDSPSPLGDIKSETEKSQLKKTTGRKLETENRQLKKTTRRKSETEKPKAKRTICRFFKQYGNCKYEDRCMYLHSFTVNSDLQSDDVATQKIDHVDLSTPLNDITPETEKTQPKKTNRPTLETRKRANCRFFKQYGNCKYGDRCRYLHETNPSNWIRTDNEETAIESVPADINLLSDGQNGCTKLMFFFRF